MNSFMAALRILPLLLVFTCGGGSALAHPAVLESAPADGEVLVRAPGEIFLRFDREIDPAGTWLNLSDRGGRGLPLPVQRKASGPTDRLTVVLPILRRGSFILHYKVVDTAGQATHGSVSFTAGGY